MSLTTIEIDERMRLLADPLRMRIVSLLAREQLCTCHLVEDTGAKQTTVSHHLKALRKAGMVESSPHGRYTYYRLLPEVLDDLADRIRGLAATARGASEARRPC